ncbi:hypothetical protein DFJ63DRAFT_126791 [Scheffersomyces coipomensis]|uniref:uncharacterized protein n=1 Tax=Scheffersomyces coipomensis TaxID=1788519 RepID=UPI00315D5962
MYNTSKVSHQHQHQHHQHHHHQHQKQIHHRSHTFAESETPSNPQIPSSSNGFLPLDHQRNEVKYYYTKLINEEFRSLQLDKELNKKTLFDLIDYCEMLYESASSSISKTSISSSSTNALISPNDLIGVQDYIKGFLIFNYFINSFIMLHFKGFDTFIKSNEQDFIIYLNVFAFYNTDELINNGPFSISLADLRSFIKQYLVEKELLKFNVDELYNWLYEYINYLKEKDRILTEESNSNKEDDSDSSSSSDNDELKSQQLPEDEIINGKDLQNLQIQVPAVDDYYYKSDSSTVPPSNNDNHFYASDPKKSFNLNPLLSRNDYNNTISSNDTGNLGETDSLVEFKNRFPSMSKIGSNNSSIKEETIPVNMNRHHLAVAPNLGPPPIASNAPSPVPSPVPQVDPPPIPLTQKAQTLPIMQSPPPFNHQKSLPEVPYALEPNRSTEDLYFQDRISNNANQRYKNGYTRPPSSLPRGPLVAAAEPTHVHVHSSNGSSFQNGNSYPSQPPQAPPPQFIPPVQYYGNGQMMMPNVVYYDNQQQQQQKFSFNHHPNNPQQVPAYTSTIIPEHVRLQQSQIKSQKLHYSKEYAVCGLRNFGSSCYINSTIQVMFGIYKFKLLFTNGEYQKFIKNPKYLQLMKNAKSNPHSKSSVLLSEAVSGLLRTFVQNGSNSIAPTKFIRVSSLLKPDFNIPYEQQDAQEFLLFVLDRLHEELADKQTFDNPIEIENYMRKWNININMNDKGEYVKWYTTVLKHEGSSPIHDLFQGHLQNKLICNKCGYESISYSQFSILSLPIPRSIHGNVVNLSDCLKYYTEEEVLSGENAWNCPKCSKNGSTTDEVPTATLDTGKRSGIFKLGKRSKSPSSIKSSGNASTHSLSSSIKTLNFIKLPQVLLIHLSRFSMYNLTDKLETSIQYPLVLKFNNNDHEIAYKLTGLINHKGNLKSGHYTSLVNKSTTNQAYSNNFDNLKHPYWCLFDDDNVRYNLQHGNINQPNFDQLKSKDVYVLCYERI